MQPYEYLNHNLTFNSFKNLERLSPSLRIRA